MPQFAKLPARGSCAGCPTRLEGHFCFCSRRERNRELPSGNWGNLKIRLTSAFKRSAVFAAMLCFVSGVAQLCANQNAAPAKESFRTVQDETGRSVRVPVPVHRVVSLAPSLTESIYALGMEDLLVGDTDYCDYPPAAMKKHKVGGATNPSLEEIAALKPDLVLVTKSLNRLDTVQQLDRLGIAAYATDPHTIDEIRSSVHRLAEVMGNPAAGEALDANLLQQENLLQKKLQNAAPKRVLFVVWTDPLISVGKHTFIADALAHAGATSVVEVFAGLAANEPGRNGAIAAGISGVRIGPLRDSFAGCGSAGEASWLGCAGGSETSQICRNQRCRQPAGSAAVFRNRRTRAATSSGIVQPEKRNIENVSVSAGGEELMRPLTLSRLLLQCFVLGAILFCVMVLALKFGAVHVSLYGLGRDLLRVFMGKSKEISSDYSLILNLRLPRILLSVIVGASLSVAGTSFQALLRNPLADPYVLGVSSGAAVGAILASATRAASRTVAGDRFSVHSSWRISWRCSGDHCGLFSRQARGTN